MSTDFNEDDMDIDDIRENIPKKKKIKSGAKGKAAERAICDKLNARFHELFKSNPTWGAFSRSIGSGNRWGQRVNLPQHAKDTFTGDITCPENFRWVLESKKGYNDADLMLCFGGKCPVLDEFLKQVSDDAARTVAAGKPRMPMLIWRKDRKEYVAFVRIEDFDTIFDEHQPAVPSTYLIYNGWKAVRLDFLLEMPDSCWFAL